MIRPNYVKFCAIFASFYGADPDSFYPVIFMETASPLIWVFVEGQIMSVPKFAVQPFTIMVAELGDVIRLI